MWVYFDCALDAVSEATIVEVFMNIELLWTVNSGGE